ncbi:MAG: N-acetylmuramoyl-L-alanine amidase [bacterium]
MQLVGNFQVETPTPAQRTSLVNRLVSWCNTYRIPSENIFGHRDFPTTKRCPGENLYTLLPGIRQEVAARVDAVLA